MVTDWVIAGSEARRSRARSAPASHEDGGGGGLTLPRGTRLHCSAFGEDPPLRRYAPSAFLHAACSLPVSGSIGPRGGGSVHCCYGFLAAPLSLLLQQA